MLGNGNGKGVFHGQMKSCRNEKKMHKNIEESREKFKQLKIFYSK